MPLHVRTIALSAAVLCFFGVSLIGWLSGLSPSTCCHRAVIGSVVGYVAGALAVRAINAILISAMAGKQVKQQRQEHNGSNS